MTMRDRIILSVLALGLWAVAGVLAARPGPADAQFSGGSIRAIIESCTVEGRIEGAVSGKAEGTVAGEVQVQHGAYGVIQNGRIVYAGVTGTLENGRLVDGRIVCPKK